MKSSLRLSTCSLVFLGIGLFTTPSSALSQALTKTAVQAPTDWHSVQSLPAQTRIRVLSNSKKTTCFIDSVTDDRLTCALQKTSTQKEFRKDEIREVQLLHRSRSHSTTAGALLGLGVGAGVGALIGVAINSGISYHTTSAKAAGAGAAVGATAGVIAGAALGSAKDWFAGNTVIYRHP